MKFRLLSACAIVLFATSIAAAQDATPAAPDPADNLQGYHEEVIVTSANELPAPRRVNDVGFWTVGGLLGTAMLFDTKSTFDVLRRCDRCYEGNPYAAPFVKRGPTAAFSAGIAFDVGVMAIAAKMKSSRHARFHRTWWVLPVVLTAGHVVAYRHNLRVGHSSPPR